MNVAFATSEMVSFVLDALSPKGVYSQLQDMYCTAVPDTGWEGQGMELL